MSGNWSPRAFTNVVDTVLSPLALTPEVFAGVAERFGAAVLERAELSDDVFRRALVSATLTVCLLPHLEHEAVACAARRLVDTTGAALIAAGSQLAADLTTDHYALLAKRKDSWRAGIFPQRRHWIIYLLDGQTITRRRTISSNAQTNL